MLSSLFINNNDILFPIYENVDKLNKIYPIAY